MADSPRTRIEEIFRRSNISLTKKQLDDFCSFFTQFQKYNDEYDLSRIKRDDEIILKHFVDSALVTTMIDLPSPILDIGTGAGFPGLPLKIMRRDIDIILAEPKDKRVAFMEMMIESLSLDGATVYPKRVADHCDFNVNGVITRAFEAVDGTLSRVKHFLPKGGKVIFMKGPAVEEDLGAMSEENLRDYRIIDDREYILPGTVHKRRLVVFEKTSEFREHVYTITDQRYAKIAISSADNQSFKEFKKLTESKGVRKSGTTIVAGKKIIAECAGRSFDRCRQLVLFDEYRERDSSFNEIIQKFYQNRKCLIVKKSLYNELDIFSSQTPLLIYEYEEPSEWDYSVEGCVLLIPFQDPANVGAVIRSAAAFGIKKIVMLSEAANPFHPKSVRASSGAVMSVKIFSGPSIDDIADQCAEKGLKIISLDASGRDIRTFKFTDNFLLLPGLEGQGVPSSLKDSSVSIPIEAGIESLNASASAAIALFYITRIVTEQ
jgi:16S rRNA (guanine(527)-N(7))-methyltransferase RsmG